MNLLNTFNVTVPKVLRGVQLNGIQKGLEKNGIDASFLNGADSIKNFVLSNPQDYLSDLNKFSVEDTANQTCEEIENRTRVLTGIREFMPNESLIVLRDILRRPYRRFNLEAYGSVNIRKCDRRRYYNGINNYKNLATKIADELDKNLNTMLGKVNGGRKKSRSRSRSKKSKSKSKRIKSKSKRK
jgi:hypothetical protein